MRVNPPMREDPRCRTGGSRAGRSSTTTGKSGAAKHGQAATDALIRMTSRRARWLWRPPNNQLSALYAILRRPFACKSPATHPEPSGEAEWLHAESSSSPPVGRIRCRQDRTELPLLLGGPASDDDAFPTARLGFLPSQIWCQRCASIIMNLAPGTVRKWAVAHTPALAPTSNPIDGFANLRPAQTRRTLCRKNPEAGSKADLADRFRRQCANRNAGDTVDWMMSIRPP